jgi:hypothetical protein
MSSKENMNCATRPRRAKLIIEPDVMHKEAKNVNMPHRVEIGTKRKKSTRRH